jgi:hypothetical protein
MNGLLIIAGIAVAAVGLYLRERTQFGRPGRPIVEEEFVRQADGSIKHYKFHLKLTKLEILALAAGFFLIVTGLGRPMKLFYIGSGILLVWMAQLYGNWLWFGNIGIGFSDSLSLAYEKLRKVGDEARGGRIHCPQSRKGHSIRGRKPHSNLAKRLGFRRKRAHRGCAWEPSDGGPTGGDNQEVARLQTEMGRPS